MRRAAIAAALTLSACQPVFYDLFESAGHPPTTMSTSEPVSGTMADPTGPDATGDPGPSTGPGDTDQPPPPTCGDGAQNGRETGLDCGGPECPPCPPGECRVPEDCETTICVEGKCLPPQCEFAKDCGFDQCRTQECDPVTKQCIYHDLDGLGCEDGDLCSQDDMCFGGVCTPGPALDCGALDGPCQLGFCNPKTGNCGVEYVDEGMPCEDGIACTVNEICMQGECFGKPMPPLFFEDFSAPQGWQLDEWWEIGPAVPSQCAEIGGEDPFDDHSPGPDEMLAGAVIGGCLPPKPVPDACLTSPPIDVPFPGELWLTFYSRLSSPVPPAEARVDVWDGQQWVLLLGGMGEPIDEPKWTEHVVDLSQFKSPVMQVRFCHHQPVDGLPVIAGWSVDDVAIGLPGCFPP